MISPARVRSPIKYAGNKYFLASALDRLICKEIPRDSRVLEPFAGSLGFSLYFGFDFVTANDASFPMYNFQRHIIDGEMPRPESEPISRDYYYRMVKRYNEIATAMPSTLSKATLSELSSLTFLINYASFNGLVRVNKKGIFNVPFGKPKASIPRAKLEACTVAHKVMKNWQMHHGCFSDLNFKGYDFLYIDPPYSQTFTALEPFPMICN